MYVDISHYIVDTTCKTSDSNKTRMTPVPSIALHDHNVIIGDDISTLVIDWPMVMSCSDTIPDRG